jgi:hypothetical protein
MFSAVGIRSGLPVDVQMSEQGNAAFNPFRGGKPLLSGRQRILWMRERHGEGFWRQRWSAAAEPQSNPLLAVAALQGDSPAFALVMVADGQHQRIDAIAVGAEQRHLPAREAVEQPPEGLLVATPALPVNQLFNHGLSKSRHCCPCLAGSATFHRVRSPPPCRVAA